MMYTTDFQINDLKLPIKSGDIVGKMFVFDKNNMVVDEINLISGDSVNKENFKELLNRIIGVW